MRKLILKFGVACVTVCSLGAQGQPATPAVLPSAEAILQQVMKQALKDEAGEREFAQTYSYTRTRVTENRDSKGKIESREEKKDVRKPAAPTPPPPAANSRTASTGTKGAESLITQAPASAVPRGKAFDRSDFILNGDLLNRFAFKVSGRELIHGRPTFVLEFRPATKQPAPKSLKDRFINKAAGRLWIDEAESILVRANLELTERVNVVGGLVGSVSAFRYEFDRERTNEGFWFTRTSGYHLEGREVVVQRNLDYKEEKSDLRKVAARK